MALGHRGQELSREDQERDKRGRDRKDWKEGVKLSFQPTPIAVYSGTDLHASGEGQRGTEHPTPCPPG